MYVRTYTYTRYYLVRAPNVLILIIARKRRNYNEKAWLREVEASMPLATRAQVAQIGMLENIILGVLGLLLVLSLSGRIIRRLLDRMRGLVHLTYPDGRRVAVVPGTTILEASRGAGIGHASVCGGRGRCSTCRVRVGAGADDLPPAGDPDGFVTTIYGSLGSKNNNTGAVHSVSFNY